MMTTNNSNIGEEDNSSIKVDRTSLDNEYGYSGGKNTQGSGEFWNELENTVNIARAKSNELSDFVAFNHETLSGIYEPSLLLNGETENREIVDSKLINGSEEYIDGDYDEKNMSNAYAYSATGAYAVAELAKTSAKSTDTYQGGHMFHDAARLVQGVTAAVSARDNRDVFIDFATSDIAKEVNIIFANEGRSFDAYLTKDKDGNLSFSSNVEVAKAYESGKKQIESYLLDRGLDLKGIKNSEIAKSVDDGSYTFGLQRGMRLSDDEKNILKAYLAMDNQALSRGRESAKVATAKAVSQNIVRGAYNSTDVYAGYRQMRTLKRTGGRVVFGAAKAPRAIILSGSKVKNRIVNANYNRKIAKAAPGNRARLGAELLGKNKAFAANQAKLTQRIDKINSVQNFYNASAFGKAKIISSKVGSQIKKTDLYKNSFLGRAGERRTQKQLEKMKKNPKKYQKKQKRIARRKKISRGFAYAKKYLMLIALALCGILLVSSFVSVALTTFIGETPFSGDKLASTEYNSVRQQAMDEALVSFQNAINWINNGEGSKEYNGNLYSVKVRYPDGHTVTYERGSSDPSTNISSLFADDNKSTIKRLKIPWTYTGTNEDGGELEADGYLGQSIYDDVYVLDEDGVIISEPEEPHRARDLELYSEVINMPIQSAWVSAFSTRNQYFYSNWQGKSFYCCGGKNRSYTMDDFFKAISSMAVEVCDITGYDDTDGQFYKNYFNAISDMALRNSYYTVDVKTVPRPNAMQYKDESNVVYVDTAYLVHCQIKIHVDASINDLMELADHYDPVNRKFVASRSEAITAWRDWINSNIAATGADNTGYDGRREYNGFFTTDSAGFAKDNKFGCYKDTSGFAYNYNNMTDEGNTACSYLFEGLTLSEWTDELGFIFLCSSSLGGVDVSSMAAIFSDEQIEDYITQIKSNYRDSTGNDLSEARVGLIRQCLSDVGKFYYDFGGKANDISNPPMGLDCSGFVGYELAKYGLITSAVHGTGDFHGSLGTAVPYDNKKPGDVIVKYTPEEDTDLNWSSHVVIYIGKFDAGDGRGNIERTVECTTSQANGSGSQIYWLSSRSYERGYNKVKSFMD